MPPRPNTRYLVQCPLGSKGTAEVRDVVVAEVSPSGQRLRVIWATGLEPLSPPLDQEWILTSDFEPKMLEEIPLYISQVNRASTTLLIPRSAQATKDSLPQRAPRPTALGVPDGM